MTFMWDLTGGEPQPLGADLLEVLTFAGGEPHVNVHQPERLAGRHVLIDARVGSFNELGKVLVVNDALRRSGVARVTLACPYLPGARQDRSEHGGPLTAKVYADIINHAGFDRVVCIDPHSPVVTALLDRVVAVPAEAAIDPSFLRPTHDEQVVLVCPDAGAGKRVEAVADAFGLSVVYARKHRNPSTGALGHFSCDPIPHDATAVVVDDICDGGGTFLGLAEAVGRPRESMRLWTTHGIYSKGLTELLARFSRIGCTDSFPSLATADPSIHTIRPIANVLIAAAATPERTPL